VSFRLAGGDIDPDFAHRLDDGRPDLVGWLLTGGFGANVGWGVALEEGLRHLRAPGVVSADEDDVLHEAASGARRGFDRTLKRIP
jgi:hypothetical protein